ncbi:hypothetical protein ANN_07242 [Periplaneta americana]|uniref:DUF4817 domain-containing protein n=1 Tax=Periplaneta americana TaxID=6978 RepID=A0ABQ8TGE1_PERAM|nr:hypothetical protein ANN_07242 [Periplaneta americana]
MIDLVGLKVHHPLVLTWGDMRLTDLFSTFCVNVKMQYTLNQRLFLVKQYWITNSIAAIQRAYQREFGVRNPPKRNTILGLVNKLETTGSLVSEKGKHRSSRLPTVVDVRARLEQSPKKSLRRLSQETGYTYSMCQTAAKSAGLKPYRVTVGYVKDFVFVPPLPANLPELRDRIINAIAAIDMDTLHRVWDYRLDVCRVTRGAHIEHL